MRNHVIARREVKDREHEADHRCECRREDDESQAPRHRDCDSVDEGHAEIGVAIPQDQVEHEAVERDSLQNETRYERDRHRGEQKCRDTRGRRPDDRLPHVPRVSRGRRATR
jgi:hypothetical protein